MMICFIISRHIKCVLWRCFYYTTQELLEMGEGFVRHRCYDTESEYLKAWKKVYGEEMLKCWQTKVRCSKNKSLRPYDLNIHFHCGDTENPGKQAICAHNYLGIATESHRTRWSSPRLPKESSQMWDILKTHQEGFRWCSGWVQLKLSQPVTDRVQTETGWMHWSFSKDNLDGPWTNAVARSHEVTEVLALQ